MSIFQTMWGTLGSFRDRVRERAKNAAQIAQGVLNAAAAEDEDAAWDESVRNNAQNHSEDYSQPLPALDEHPLPPPSPPSDFQSDLQPPPPPPPFASEPNKRRGKRKTRYVVANLPNVTEQQPPAASILKPPMPSTVTGSAPKEAVDIPSIPVDEQVTSVDDVKENEDEFDGWGPVDDKNDDYFAWGVSDPQDATTSAEPSAKPPQEASFEWDSQSEEKRNPTTDQSSSSVMVGKVEQQPSQQSISENTQKLSEQSPEVLLDETVSDPFISQKEEGPDTGHLTEISERPNNPGEGGDDSFAWDIPSSPQAEMDMLEISAKNTSMSVESSARAETEPVGEANDETANVANREGLNSTTVKSEDLLHNNQAASDPSIQAFEIPSGTVLSEGTGGYWGTSEGDASGVPPNESKAPHPFGKDASETTRDEHPASHDDGFADWGEGASDWDQPNGFQSESADVDWFAGEDASGAQQDLPATNVSTVEMGVTPVTEPPADYSFGSMPSQKSGDSAKEPQEPQAQSVPFKEESQIASLTMGHMASEKAPSSDNNGPITDSNEFWNASQSSVTQSHAVPTLTETEGETDMASDPTANACHGAPEASSLSETYIGDIQSKSEMQVVELQEQLRTLCLERDAALTAKQVSSTSIDDLKRSLYELREELSLAQDECTRLSAENASLQNEKKVITQEKITVERERDAAVVRGGDGIREARNAIEELRNNQESSEQREAVIGEQIEILKADLDRISEQKNAVLQEANDLRTALKDAEQRNQQMEDGLRQQLAIVQNERDIASLEREKAFEANCIRNDESERLLEEMQSRISMLSSAENKVIELEALITNNEKARDDEARRIDLFSAQIEEMRDRTQGVIQERNELYNEKLGLRKALDTLQEAEGQLNRKLSDAEREKLTIKGERDEARQRYVSVKDQNKELSKRVDLLSVERDRLVQERSQLSSSGSEKENALAKECEQKTKQLAVSQKRLHAAAGKIEKLTAQRGLYQRQRDEAGSRLRAAGDEFASLHNRLTEVSSTRDRLESDITTIRDERDALLEELNDLKQIRSEKILAEENLTLKAKEASNLQQALDNAREELSTLNKEMVSLKQKQTALTAENRDLNSQLEISSKERGFIEDQKNRLESEKAQLMESVSKEQRTHSELQKQITSLETELSSQKDIAATKLRLVQSELEAENKACIDARERLSAVQAELKGQERHLENIKGTLRECLRSGNEKFSSNRDDILQWPEVAFEAEDNAVSEDIADLLDKICSFLMDVYVNYSGNTEMITSMRSEHARMSERIQVLEEDHSQLSQTNEQAIELRTELEKIREQLEYTQSENLRMSEQLRSHENELSIASQRNIELEQKSESVSRQLREDAERAMYASSEEKALMQQDMEKMANNLRSIYSMLQRAVVSHNLPTFSENMDEFDEMPDSEGIAIMALRGTASIVAELGRNYEECNALKKKLSSIESDIARLTDRAEIAEQERNTARGANERLERKADAALQEGKREAAEHYDAIVGQLEDDLEDAKHEASRFADQYHRAEKEKSDLKGLCNKLTSQVNGRTNELDEAEEKVVYLQDQVTTLEEDLEEAHGRLRQLEAESAEARRGDVDRLTSQLKERAAQLSAAEQECARLRQLYDEAEAGVKESSLAAETHRKAEENLQIAIEQLEAAQESAVEQRTIQLEKQVEEAEEKYKKAVEREEEAKVARKKLTDRDEEIRELRGAIGRLADERVELKLELEKSLSRLNHPDAGGQLVDRRVVRQLLVSYFRVGSVRRRDVLELMSRMLAFSESDNIAVGLKRRALMDRLGSLVQAPELDDATLPPLGTVSDKWIEFLMKETEEVEDQGKGW